MCRLLVGVRCVRYMLFVRCLMRVRLLFDVCMLIVV